LSVIYDRRYSGPDQAAVSDCTVTAEIKNSSMSITIVLAIAGNVPFHTFGKRSWGKGWVKFSRISTSPMMFWPSWKNRCHHQGRAESHAKAESEKLNKRLAQIRHRLEQAYIDKLDGKSLCRLEARIE
jgi:hypothetical protein